MQFPHRSDTIAALQPQPVVMPYTVSANSTTLQSGGLILSVEPDIDPRFSEVSPEGCPWFEGSVFAIEELWRLNFVVNDTKLVYKNNNWCYPKLKLGSYQLLDQSGIPRGESHEGYLSYTTTYFREISYWTVGSDIPNRVYKIGTDEIDNCQFATTEITLSVKAVEIKYQSPVSNDSIFKVRRSAKAVKLKDFEVKRALPSVGIFLYPGVSLANSTYRMGLINLAPIDEPELLNTACNPPTADTCTQEFEQYIIEQWNGFKDGEANLPGGSNAFRTEAACAEAIPYQIPQSNQYTCENGETRIFWWANAYG